MDPTSQHHTATILNTGKEWSKTVTMHQQQCEEKDK
jgi:hypothetical protein